MKYSIACGIDNNYVQHASVMLMSLSIVNKNASFDIYILSLNVSEDSKERVSELFENSNLNIHFIDIRDSLLNTFPIGKTDYLSIAAYLRLFLPIVLPDYVDKVLYLDSDIIIQSSIIELFDIDISSYYGAACLDFNQHHCDRLGYNINLGYYNSGVFMLNIQQLRSFNFVDNVLKFVRHSNIQLIYHDQDILNYLLKGKIKTIEHKWNMLECFYLNNSSKDLFDDLEDSFKDIRIIHFSSAFKPWNWGCRHPQRKAYFNYLEMIPWGNPSLHKFYAFNRLRFWAKIVIVCGGSTITIDKIKNFVYGFLNLILPNKVK